ncbi:MAG: AraC family transcriptional regulator [Treponema sp.]|jgi:AraC-like DNA-binding protein|nr:AraC family transcriptional regulator [Treponema sp.]
MKRSGIPKSMPPEGDEISMVGPANKNPWYQNQKFDPLFPFHYMDSDMQAFDYHWHANLELVYLIRGKIFASVEGISYEVLPRDIMVISSGAIHGYFNAEPDTLTGLFRFGPELFDQNLMDLRDEVSQKWIFDRQVFFTPEKDGEIHCRLEELLLSIRREYYVKEEGYRLAIKTALNELGLIFLRKIPPREALPGEGAKRNRYHKILERTFRFIYNNFTDPSVTLDKAAEAAALSRFYFSRFFKEQTGQTFHAYLSKLRISQAQAYLNESDLSIIDIAYLCGFGSLEPFNRLFKIYTGVTPSSYREGKAAGKMKA